MTSRPLLDYLAYDEEPHDTVPAQLVVPEPQTDPIAVMLKDIEGRLRANSASVSGQAQDLTLSAQIDAILKRRTPRPAATDQRPIPPSVPLPTSVPPARAQIAPPPTAPAANDLSFADQDFQKFSEAVYLIGQAAKRFVEQPEIPGYPVPVPQVPVQSVPVQPTSAGPILHQAALDPAVPLQPERAAPVAMTGVAPSSGEIDALSDMLRDTLSAFRSVADDLAVSAAEIRKLATRDEQAELQLRAQQAARRDDEEIRQLRDGIADLQDRLDHLLNARRASRS